MRASKAKLNRSDQLPFRARSHFSALSPLISLEAEENATDGKLSLFVAILYVIDMFGIFPFLILPGLLVQLGLFGVPLMVFVIVLQMYTSFLLSQCWLKAELLDFSIVSKSRYPYAAIANLAYGPHAKVLVTVLLDLSILFGGIPNIIIASTNIERIANHILDGQFPFSFCYAVLIIGLIICPISWLKSPKHMRGLAMLSVCVIMCVVLLLWFCLFSTSPPGFPFEGITLDLPPFSKFLSAYCILAFQFDIHPMLLTLQIDMQQKQQVSWAVFIGISVTCSIAIVGALLSAYKFGAMVSENILRTLPKSVPLYVMLVLMSFQLCFSVAANSSALYLQIENYFQIPEVFSIKRVAIRSSMVIFQIVISEFVPSFDALMDILGGTITGPIIFILPPLLYRRMRQMEQRLHGEVTYGTMSLEVHHQKLECTPLACAKQKHTWKICFILQNICLRIMHRFDRIHCDLSLSMAVLLFGLTATIFSTYSNIFQLNILFKSNSPCFSNTTTVSY